MICDMPGDRIALRLPQQEVAVKQEAESIDLDRLGRVFVEEAKDQHRYAVDGALHCFRCQ
jgi:hypothetical protein